VSRPTVYRQMNRANGALDALFTPAACADDKVLFTLPVTRRGLEQVALGLTLIGHASFRGVIEFMHDLLGVPLSLGTVHDIHQRAARQAIALNADIDLSSVRVGLHDELFQGSQPVLAGIDIASTYCYLLAPEAHRDGDTWAIHLLDLQAQGLNPDYTIADADAGTGLRAGQKTAWPARRATVTCFTSSSKAGHWRTSGVASRAAPARHARPPKHVWPIPSDAARIVSSRRRLKHCGTMRAARISWPPTCAPSFSGSSATSCRSPVLIS
jgi:hypothetical protein